MFKEWHQAHPLENIDFSSALFPPAKERTYWEGKTEALTRITFRFRPGALGEMRFSLEELK